MPFASRKMAWASLVRGLTVVVNDVVELVGPRLILGTWSLEQHRVFDPLPLASHRALRGQR